MVWQKLNLRKIILLITLCGVGTLLKGTYFQDTLFPLGFTGFNYTGSDQENYCPYSNRDTNWTWTEEREILDSTDVNCIGSEDAYPRYLINLAPNPGDSYDYLHQVCDDLGDVYIITAGFYTTNYCHGDLRWQDSLHTDTTKPWIATRKDTLAEDSTYILFEGTDSAVTLTPPHHKEYKGSTDNIRASTLFRTWHYDYYGGTVGYSADEFDSCGWNWCNDASWNKMMDSAVINLDAHFQNNSTHDDYIWGWTVLTEGPAIYRGAGGAPNPQPYHGIYAAVNRVIKGADGTKGIRKVEEDRMSSNRRMIVAKGGTWPLHMANINIFEFVPELDAFLVYGGDVRADCNYGEQKVFDAILYDTYTAPTGHYKTGYHNTAIYMQQYGKTNLVPGVNQKRRWMAGLQLQWIIEKNIDSVYYNVARARRGCPPELRCICYLVLSRGAKGILFHPWTQNWSYKAEYNGQDTTVSNMDPYMTIPATYTKYWGREVGLRDFNGWPFGYWERDEDDEIDSLWYVNNNTRHRLNNTSGSTYWHSHNWDTTFNYLAHALIPELKKIKDVLIQLDWVNGYSLNSTDPEWRSPCPHDYVMEVAGVSYMDLGLFDHPYEPIGVEYFMLVNREGIADMTNRTVTVALDANHWPEEDTLILTDIANSGRPRRLSREGDRFTFTEVFEPGEGKLYRAAPVNEAPVTLLNR